MYILLKGEQNWTHKVENKPFVIFAPNNYSSPVEKVNKQDS